MSAVSKQMDLLSEMKHCWYRSVDDLVDSLKDAGFEIEDANAEYIDAWGEGIGGLDVMFTLKLAGVPGTIVISDVSVKAH